MFYSLHENWSKIVHPVLASMLPIPQRYYVPGRVRDSYRPRLEASGLWALPGIEQEEKKPFKENIKPREDANKTEKFLRVFEREKVNLDNSYMMWFAYYCALGLRKSAVFIKYICKTAW